jgi:hypothetical protein
MTSKEFETSVLATKWQQTYALDRKATWIDIMR